MLVMRLRDWMKDSGMTDQGLADAIGVSRVQVFRYKFGKAMPRPRVMAKIVEVTGGAVTYDDLAAVYVERNPSDS